MRVFFCFPSRFQVDVRSEYQAQYIIMNEGGNNEYGKRRGVTRNKNRILLLYLVTFRNFPPAGASRRAGVFFLTSVFPQFIFHKRI